MTQRRRGVLDAVLEEAGLEENLSEKDRADLAAKRAEDAEDAEFKARLEAHNRGEQVDWTHGDAEPAEAVAEPPQEAPAETLTEPAEDFVPFEERPAPPSTDERAEVMKTLREILGVPKQRSALPTLVRFKQDGRHMWRAVIVDIGEIELQKGWELWKERMDLDGEHYLLAVYELTESEIPRMYRTVGEMRLE